MFYCMLGSTMRLTCDIEDDSTKNCYLIVVCSILIVTGISFHAPVQISLKAWHSLKICATVSAIARMRAVGVGVFELAQLWIIQMSE